MRSWAKQKMPILKHPNRGNTYQIGQSYTPSVHIPKGDLLASIGLYRDAEREYDRARQILGRNLFAHG